MNLGLNFFALCLFFIALVQCEDECAGVTCLYNAMCIPEPKQCITTPCPQYRCECPEVKCSSSLAEVCGTDGNTYDNDCILQKAICRTQGRIQLEHEGPCASKELCAESDCMYGAVCIPEPKQCITTPCPQFRCQCPTMDCSNDYQPICGTDGKTYDNSCTLQQAICRTQGFIQRAYKGACENKDIDLCANNNCLYSAMCVPEPKQCFTTPCPQYRCDCPQYLCTTEYAPVCGTDGNVYNNKCSIQQNICKTQGRTQIAFHKSCSDENCDIVCDQMYSPVCGSDDKTYPNLCTLESTNCQKKSSVSVLYAKECVELKWENFEKADKDHNGFLSFEDFENMIPSKHQTQEFLFSHYDINRDGKISANDFEVNANTFSDALVGESQVLGGVIAAIVVFVGVVAAIAVVLVSKKRSSQGTTNTTQQDFGSVYAPLANETL